MPLPVFTYLFIWLGGLNIGLAICHYGAGDSWFPNAILGAMCSVIAGLVFTYLCYQRAAGKGEGDK